MYTLAARDVLPARHGYVSNQCMDGSYSPSLRFVAVSIDR
jgi:hypothetical protein